MPPDGILLVQPVLIRSALKKYLLWRGFKSIVEIRGLSHLLRVEREQPEILKNTAVAVVNCNPLEGQYDNQEGEKIARNLQECCPEIFIIAFSGWATGFGHVRIQNGSAESLDLLCQHLRRMLNLK